MGPFYKDQTYEEWNGLATLSCKKKTFTAVTKVRGRGQFQGSRYRWASGHDSNPVLLGGPTAQIAWEPRHQRDLPTQMRDVGESLRDPCVLRDAGWFPCLFFNFGSTNGVEDRTRNRWNVPWVKIQRVLILGSWNVLSLPDPHWLPHILDELSRVKVDIIMVRLSETRRSGSGEASGKGFSYYWSGMSNGHLVKGVAIGISSRLQPSVVEVTLMSV